MLYKLENRKDKKSMYLPCCEELLRPSEVVLHGLDELKTLDVLNLLVEFLQEHCWPLLVQEPKVPY
jgi:hypothetical protein